MALTITDKIIELFANKKVNSITTKTIKELIPNYMDYAITETYLDSDKYLQEETNELMDILDDFIGTKKEFIDRIYISLNRLNNIKDDDIINVKTESNTYVYSTKEYIKTESENEVLYRLTSEIKSRKMEINRENREIEKMNETLMNIVNNPELMERLFKIKEGK